MLTFASMLLRAFNVRVFAKSAAVAMWLCSVVAVGRGQGTTPFRFVFANSAGPYAVGLRVVEQYDRSRTFAPQANKSGEEQARPVQTLVWYPAEAVVPPGSAMTVGEYASLVKAETSFGKPVATGMAQADVERYTHGTTAIRMRAVANAAVLGERFPIVIYAPSLNATALENIELCEYLTSYGFVVMASPSMGATSRKMTIDVAGANAEAADIAFLIGYAKGLADTDSSKVAVMGYSWGGMAGLFAAARDKRIGALISLDGSFRYSPSTVQEAGDVHPERMTIPLLVFSRAEETLESWDAMREGKKEADIAPSVLNRWTKGDLLHVRMLAMSHIQFSSLFQRSERFLAEALQFSPADYSLQEGNESYDWVARYCLEFLRAYMKREPEAVAFLKRTPAENGVPKHVMSSSFRAASVAGK
jgi:pimeloyl-ACP methyl ester carboxylesterase